MTMVLNEIIDYRRMKFCEKLFKDFFRYEAYESSISSNVTIK